MHEELQRAVSGHGRLVLLSGEAGIGKTSLAREAVGEAAAARVTILTGHCYDLSSSPPYGVWLDLALGYGQEPGAPPLPAAFAGGQIDEIESQAALFAETLGFLTALARRAPVLVLLEDLHWADGPSLELLRFLAARSGTLPVLFLVTYRVDELTRKHPLYQQLPGLIRAGVGLRLDLKRLDAAAIRRLAGAHHRLTPEDETRLCAYLEQHSEGNPFFAVELMRALEDDGLLTRAGEQSRLGTLDRVVLPSLLTQVIDLRLARLGEATRKPLSIAAVIGQDIPLDLWAEVAGLKEAELLTIVEEAIDAHLLEADRSGQRVRFVHALTREALYESSFPPRRRGWHRAVGEALIARPNPDPDAIGFHLLQAGDDRAAEWLTRAGERAQRAYTWLVAAERFVAAAAALEGRPEAKRERGWLLFRAARMLRLGEPWRGFPLLTLARELAEAAGDPLLAGDAAYSTGLLQTYTNEYIAGLATITAGIAQLEAFPPGGLPGERDAALALADSLPRNEAEADMDIQSSAELHRRLGLHHRRGGIPWVYAAGGLIQEATRIAELFVARANTVPSPGPMVRSAIGHAEHGLGLVRAAAGRVDESKAAFAAARATYRTIDHHGVIAICCLTELDWRAIPYAADVPGDRRHLSEEAKALFEIAGGAMTPGLSSGVCWLATHWLDGQWDKAAAIVDEAPPATQCMFQSQIALAAARITLARGEFARTRRILGEWFPNGPDEALGRRHYRHATQLLLVAAELALIEGDTDGARAWLSAHDRWIDWAGDGIIGKTEGLLGWAAFARELGDSNGARRHATDALALASEPRQPLALIHAHRLLGALGAGGDQAARAHLDAALALAERCEAPYEIALTDLAIAESPAARRDSAWAEPHAARARDRLRELGAEPALHRLAAHRPAERAAPALPFGLTAREAEVLHLVAQGLTDAAVAERLFISPRTVSQHLRSVYGKLDVNTRAAATRTAIEHGLA